MSLTGILLDVSGPMKSSIRSGIDEQGGPWAQSIFKVMVDLIEHDLTSENRVFGIGVGANCIFTQIFDVIGTLQEIENLEMGSDGKRMRTTRATTERIDEILDILERNGARNIRQWMKDITFIQDELSENLAVLVLKELRFNVEFLKIFVHDFLPPICRDCVTVRLFQSIRMPDSARTWCEDAVVRQCSYFRSARRQDIEKVVEKAKGYIFKDYVEIANGYFFKTVRDHSIFSVEDASRIIRGCLNENELTTERRKELLENVEPFIYGKSPLYESLEKAAELFESDNSENKMLFVLSVGMPSDGSNEDNVKIRQITSELREAGVKVVSCFVTSSTDIDPKRLYDKIQPGWEPGGKFLFSLSSHVPTQHLPRAILVKRGWKIDIASNETRLFVQVNHPDNLRDACDLAKNVVCSSDALSELLVSVHLDIYINRTASSFRARDQGDELTCYAFASAVVLHLAMQRIHGREGGYPKFEELKDEMIREHGTNRGRTEEVLAKIYPKYRLHYRKVSIKEAKEAISEKRPVVAKFYLTNKEWDAFDEFYEANPTGRLTRKKLDVPKPPNDPLSGHAVVLTSYNSQSLTFMNSYGVEWANNGFFRVENAEVLGNQLEFFDVYWKVDELSDKEKERYRKHGSELAGKLIELLEGLEFAEYSCPKTNCQRVSLVTEFTGTLSKVRCPKCFGEFSANDNAGNILALNIYLTSLSG